jgi:hypothetical protein
MSTEIKYLTCQQWAQKLFFSFVNLFNEDDIKNTNTGGDTQKAERFQTSLFSLILEEEGFVNDITYKQASSQKPYDFRILCDTSISPEEFRHMRHLVNRGDADQADLKSTLLLIEMKKTQSGSFILNDTLPTNNSWYIMFYNKKRTKKNNKKYMYLVKGSALKDAINLKHAGRFTNVDDYMRDIQALKEKYPHHPRPNLSVTVSAIDEVASWGGKYSTNCIKKAI